MLTIYGVYRSRATRPLWLLGEIGLPFRHVPVIQSYRLADATAPDAPLNTASPDYLAVNPLGQIPAMEEDGLVLTESLAITFYLARKHGGDLGPRDLTEEALMLQWALLAVSAIEVSAIEILYAVAKGDAASEAEKAGIEAAAVKLRRPLARIEAHLAQAAWLVGGRFTVADICLAECLRYAQGHPTLLAEFPATKGWLETCQARPAFGAMWAARMDEPA